MFKNILNLSQKILDIIKINRLTIKSYKLFLYFADDIVIRIQRENFIKYS